MKKAKQICPNFDDITISTKTIIGYSNLNVKIQDVFNNIETTDYVVIKKKRGRKKKKEVVNPNTHLKDGDIITLKYQEFLKGVDLKDKGKTNSSGKKKFFRNAITVVMFLDNKLVNFKISENGKFQITGCKSDEQAINTIKLFWNRVSPHYPTLKLKITFLTVMTNIDFNLGFIVNRENLDKYINRMTEYNSLLETSFGYTGVNIKFPIEEKIDMDLHVIEWNGERWNQSTVLYSNFINTFSDKDRNKILNKKRYNTFLVFHSGNVIMSGMVTKYMRNVYNHFIDITKKARNEIEEKLES